jgi:hypothetical protein
MPDLPVQTPFEFRVLQWSLTQVISEEDAECLAKIIIRLTEAADDWADPTFREGEHIALKALICSEVMRSYKIKAGQDVASTGRNGGSEPSFANICRDLQTAGSTMKDEDAWRDFVKYTSSQFKDDVLRGLQTRLASFMDLGPYQANC